jgi:hypothetical protein
MSGVRSPARYVSQIMTHIALLWVIHMLTVAAGGTAGRLDALQRMMLRILPRCTCYLFSSCSRNI